MFCLAVYVIDFCQSRQTKATKFANHSLKLSRVVLKLDVCQYFSKLPHVFFKVVICKTRLQDIFKVVTCISQTSCYMYLSVRASMPGSLLYLAILSRYFFRSIDVVLQHWEVWHQTESLR